MKLTDYDLAKTLQELGYDGEYHYCHVHTDCGHQIMHLDDCEKHRGEIIRLCAAPRLDDAAYWIRDKYSVFIDLRYTRENIRKGSNRSWAYILKEMDSLAVQYGDSFYCSYELALEAAVTKAIEIINSRNKSERESNKNKKNR